MAETTVIETTAETVSEETETIPIEELEADEVPTYTVAMAIEWMKRPENDARIRSMVERAQQAEKTFVQAADREIGKVGRLLIDMGTSDDILEDFTASFLSSITGIGR